MSAATHLRLVDQAPRWKDPHGKPPPNDLDGEMDLISHVLMEGSRYDDVAGIVQAEHFYSPAHRAIWEAIAYADEIDAPINERFVAAILQDRERLAGVGGFAYIESLRIGRPAIGHGATRVAQRIRERWRLRELVQRCWEAIGEAYDPQVIAQEHLERAESRIAEIAHDTGTMVAVSASEDANDVLDKLGRANEGGYVTTGIEPLDRKVGGLFDGDAIILGARPGVGKSALAMQIAHHVSQQVDAKGTKLGALVLSREMPRALLVLRLLCALGNVDFERARRKDLGSDEWRSLLAVRESVSSNLKIVDADYMTPRHVRAQARAVASKFRKEGELSPGVPRVRLGLIVVDYLQLLDCSCLVSAKAEERQRIDAGAEYLRRIARVMKVPMLCLSAMNRADRKDSDRRPRMEDLRGSSGIEANADAVWILHREDVANLGGRKGRSDMRGIAEIDIPKARHGSVGRVITTFERGRFLEPVRQMALPSDLDF